jgi:hypothetical protein
MLCLIFFMHVTPSGPVPLACRLVLMTDLQIYLENLLAFVRRYLLWRTRASKSRPMSACKPKRYCLYYEDCMTALAMSNFAAVTTVAFVSPLPAAHHHIEWTTLLLLVVDMFASSVKERPTHMY